MTERDFDNDPYTPDEHKVAEYLREIVPEIGTGDDPIGFLIASHRLLSARLRRIRATVNGEYDS